MRVCKFDKVVNLIPRQNCGVCAFLALIAPVNQVRPSGGLAGESRPPFEAAEEIAIDSRSAFDLYRDEFETVVNDDINLIAALVTPEIEVGRQSAVRTTFEEFSDHPCLEQGASLRMDEKLLHILDSDQIGGEAGIVEIELRGLGEAFAEVSVMRWKQVHDV